MRIRTVCTAIVALMLAAPPLVRAQPAEPRWRFDGISSLAVTPRTTDLSSTVWTTSLAVAHTFDSGLRVSLDGGFSVLALTTATAPDQTGLDFGNVLLGAGYALPAPKNAIIRAGLRVGAPLATFPGGIADNRRIEHAHLVSLNAQGLQNPWLWTLNIVPIVIDLTADLTLGAHTRLSGAISPAALISINMRPSRLALLSRLSVQHDLGAWFLASALSWYLAGLALENHDFDQWAIQAGLGRRFGPHRAEVGATVGLDSPWGVFDDAPRASWALQLRFTFDLGSRAAAFAAR